MTTIIILSIVLLIFIVYSIFSTIGLLKGMKKSEHYESMIVDMKNRITETYNEMVEIDTLGAFESDDDVGTTFKQLKMLMDELQDFTQQNINLEDING